MFISNVTETTAVPFFHQLCGTTSSNISFVSNGSSTVDLDLIGHPGPCFHVIHLTAMTVLFISALACTGLISYACICGRHLIPKTNLKRNISGRSTTRNQSISTNSPSSPTSAENGFMDTSQYRLSIASSQLDVRMKTGCWNRSRDGRTRLNFWDWIVGERLIIYIAISDFFMDVSHFTDHAYIYYRKRHPPDAVCTAIAFFTHEFVLSQSMLILSSAGSACVYAVFNKKLNLGRWDYRLHAFAFGLPAIIGIFGACFGLLGQSGAWCYFDLRNPAGQWYLKLVSVLHTSYILLLSISYLAIWMKIKRTAKPVNTDRRYRGSSRTMSFLVVIYVIQYSPSVLLSVWSWFGPPHLLVYFLSAVFVNSGGVLNCFAYMYITRDRRRRNNVGLENR